jgi:hypothetical protein
MLTAQERDLSKCKVKERTSPSAPPPPSSSASAIAQSLRLCVVAAHAQ